MCDSQRQSLSLVGITNGFAALVNYGLSSRDSGFGNTNIRHSWKYPMGHLAHVPRGNSDEEVVEELSALLTSGRLSKKNKQLVLQRYSYVKQQANTNEALKVALQLIIFSPEYQTVNTVRQTETLREPSASTGSTTEPYKAILNLYLFGGMDSFFMLAPATSCSIYPEYNATRGEAASLTADKMNEVDAQFSNQGCQKYGVHKNLQIMKDLYDSSDGLFVANIGHLDKPVTKFNYFSNTRAQLFSHFDMMKEVSCWLLNRCYCIYVPNVPPLTCICRLFFKGWFC